VVRAHVFSEVIYLCARIAVSIVYGLSGVIPSHCALLYETHTHSQHGIFLSVQISNTQPSEAGARLHKNSVRPAKKTPHFTVTKINRLTLFKEIIAVYGESNTEHTYKIQLLIAKSGGTHSY
jgi:hypothetical protein